MTIRKGGALSGGTAAIANQLQTDSFQITDDASDNLGIYDAPTGGTEIAYFKNDGGGNLLFSAISGKALILASNNGTQSLSSNSSGNLDAVTYFSKYKNISTAGLGLPAIYKIGAQTLYTNAAPTTLSYTPPATAGRYSLGASLNILTGGTLTFKVKITYTDAGGNARTIIPLFIPDGAVGTTLVAGGPAANSTGRLSMVHWDFDIDNSGTAITIQDNAGTYTAGTYYWIPVLEQLG